MAEWQPSGLFSPYSGHGETSQRDLQSAARYIRVSGRPTLANHIRIHAAIHLLSAALPSIVRCRWTVICFDAPLRTPGPRLSHRTLVHSLRQKPSNETQDYKLGTDRLRQQKSAALSWSLTQATRALRQILAFLHSRNSSE